MMQAGPQTFLGKLHLLDVPQHDCWKMCESTTMVSLKFPLQDPLQQVASNNTTIISNKLICFNKQIDLLIIQHLLEIIPSESKSNWEIKTAAC